MPAKTPTPSSLMRPAEVADLLGVTSDTIRRWTKTGKLTAQRTLGNQRRYRREDIEAMAAALASGTDKATA